MGDIAAAYYNDTDRHCALWLRNLCSAGLIVSGHIDTRDVRDITPTDLSGFTQVHLFAGIGLWSYALRLAGWSDDRPIWTCSCPCQPFSAAGDRAGFADGRHLWPAAHWLIAQQRPLAIIGEQVSGPHGQAWLDVVFSDLESLGYQCGAVAVTSAGIGAPNMRHRIYWVADASGYRCGERRQQIAADQQQHTPGSEPHRRRQDGGVDHTPRSGREGLTGHQEALGTVTTGNVGSDRLAFTEGERWQRTAQHPGGEGRATRHRPQRRRADSDRMGHTEAPRLAHTDTSHVSRPWWWSEGRGSQSPSSPLHPWSQLEWIRCSDGKVRPAQPGIFPLAARHSGDVAKLRAYGNAINPIVAAYVIRAWLDDAD